MAKQTFTVTLADGRTAKRTSETRTYTHAVVLGAEDPQLVRRNLCRTLDMARDELAQLEAAIAAARVTIKPRFSGASDTDHQGKPWHHGFLVTLAGTPRNAPVDAHSNSKGVTKGGMDQTPEGEWITGSWDSDREVPAREALLASARNRVFLARRRIQDTEAMLVKLEEGALDLGTEAVLSWHTSEALAFKAGRSWTGEWATRRFRVQAVDAK